MLKFLKPLSFIPALLIMFMIFSFSDQNGETSSALSYKVGYKAVEITGEILHKEWDPQHIDSIVQRYHYAIRKIGHVTEYFALAVAVSFPLYVYGLRGFFLMIVTGLICVSFACGDEYHQAFVEGRGPSKKDVAIDSFGIFWGVIGVRIIGWIGRKTIFRKRTKKPKQVQKEIQVPEVFPQQIIYQAMPYQQVEQMPQEEQPAGKSRKSEKGRKAKKAKRPEQPNEFTQSTPTRPVRYSDQLSEDMSFRKLMRDLKDQRKK